MVLYANWKSSPVIQTIMEKQSEKVEPKDFDCVEIRTMEDLQGQAIRLKELGFDVYYKDLTLDEVKPIGMVYKVMIPQMIPLTQYDNIRWLSSLIKNGKTMADINPYPQPFS